jgi:hypothetical protein
VAFLHEHTGRKEEEITAEERLPPRRGMILAVSLSTLGWILVAAVIVAVM